MATARGWPPGDSFLLILGKGPTLIWEVLERHGRRGGPPIVYAYLDTDGH